MFALYLVGGDMRLSLNGWQRIGVVLSSIWIIGAGLYQRNADLERASHMGAWAMRVCEETQGLKHMDYTPCAAEFAKEFSLFLEGSWGGVVFVAIAPMALGWLGVYAAIGIVRWIKRGFAVW
jgi:hypothetical protein